MSNTPKPFAFEEEKWFVPALEPRAFAGPALAYSIRKNGQRKPGKRLWLTLRADQVDEVQLAAGDIFEFQFNEAKTKGRIVVMSREDATEPRKLRLSRGGKAYFVLPYVPALQELFPEREGQQQLKLLAIGETTKEFAFALPDRWVAA